MKKTIIKSSLFAIVCLLAVSSKSFAQTKEKQKADPVDKCVEKEKERMGPVGRTELGERAAEHNCRIDQASDPAKFEKEYGN